MMTKVTLFLMASASELCIPWNAAQYINAWVYRVLNRANPAWGDAAHHAQNRAIRPFSITPLDFPTPVQARAQGLIPQSGAAVLQIGAADGAIAQALLDYALAEPLIVGNMVYYVDAIISTPVITTTPIRGFLQSPMVIA